ncbi:MAG: hypothetical protein O2849_00185 [Proteobacteria bacterium]|nr:hypothetical protein [Pseudomonadota bacterium]
MMNLPPLLSSLGVFFLTLSCPFESKLPSSSVNTPLVTSALTKSSVVSANTTPDMDKTAAETAPEIIFLFISHLLINKNKLSNSII